MAFPQGIYFRATDNQVDPTNYDCIAGGSTPGVSYPFPTAQGNVVGWETAPSGGRDRGGAGAVELRGMHFLTAAAVSNFRIDLPGAGAYNIRAAFGDQTTTATGAKAQFLDGSTPFATPVPAGTSITGGRFIDATGVVRTTQGDWTTNNAVLSNTFSSAIFRVALGGSTATAPMAAVYIESAGGTSYNVGVDETFTAADGQATTAILPSAVNDNASATDTTSNNAVLPSARADTLTAVDTQATTATLPSAVADTITMADAPSNVAVLPSAIAESAPITDQEQTNGPQAVTIAETITLTDQFNAQLVANQTIAESAPVTSAQSAAVILNLSLAEAASLSDTVAAQLAAFVSMQEAASAQDLSAAQLIANIAVQEALAFQDAVAQAGSVLTAPKCNILAGAPRTRTLTGAPRVRLLHGGCC